MEHIPIEMRSPSATIAEGLYFLKLPAQDHAAHNVDFYPPRISCGHNNAHRVNITHTLVTLNLLDPDDIADDAPIPRNPLNKFFVTFDESRDVSPSLMIIEPSSDDPTIAWKASAFGMIIESFKIDRSVIPQPNPLVNLAFENAHFANSAIPT